MFVPVGFEPETFSSKGRFTTDLAIESSRPTLFSSHLYIFKFRSSIQQRLVTITSFSFPLKIKGRKTWNQKYTQNQKEFPQCCSSTNNAWNLIVSIKEKIWFLTKTFILKDTLTESELDINLNGTKRQVAWGAGHSDEQRANIVYFDAP